MGQKLAAYFEKAQQLGGAQARIAFVKLVALAASQAEAMPDSPELLAKFEAAFQQIQKQFGKK